MSTPTPGKARQSGIPTPGKPSSIPTPGRPRSTSSALQYPPQTQDDAYISRAFADAIKANDPALHRPGRSSDVSTASLSPSSAAYPPAQNGRRSVAGRPSSVASSSSALSSVPPRTPTTTSRSAGPRPASRQSDVFARSSSRAGRTFDVGDSVRIESLGYEGTLRYLGEIDGKPGHWAGVELSGGFSGKGKNNGAVNGKQYFICPSNCGVFVATTKLSAPTAGYLPMSRPSSVASSRSGRVTPSFSMSGRITPSTSTTMSTGRKTPSVSTSNGRVTPSFNSGRMTPSASTGRRTPGIGLPMSRSRSAAAHQTPSAVTPVRPATSQTPITPGSRASKYIGMTAKQLSSRGTGAVSPSRNSVGTQSPTRSTGFSSPIHGSTHLPSPSRHTSSPFNTPKAVTGGRTSNIGVGMPSITPSKTRPSLNTPRARVPSAVAMPPPASPSLSSQLGRSVSLTDPHMADRAAGSLSELENNGKALQDKIAELMAGKIPSASRPTSSASVDSNLTAELQSQVERMQTQLASLEDENGRLRNVAGAQEQEASARVEKLVTEQKQNVARIAELEAAVRSNERLVSEKETTIEGLERAAKQTELDIDKIKNDAEARARDIQSKLDDKEALVINLKELIEAKEGLQTENDAVLQAKDAEIALLEARVKKAYSELEEERMELGNQVDELRKAGQETIALYEERLSAADSQRYELEDLVASLEEQLRKQADPPSPTSAQRQAASAIEIDNETLREQVQHLQKRVAVLEDQLEEAHTTFDREEAAVRDRIKRYKEREDNMRKELGEGRKEVDRVSKSEESARQRIEEMEEALRENTVALENARAEIEGLRSEISALEGITSGITASNSSEKVAELMQRSANERVRLMEEIANLKQQLAQAQTQSNVSTNGSMDRESGETVEELRQLVSTLESDKALLQQACDERTADLDSMRKKLNRDIPLNGVDSGKGTPSKHDLAAARDEITGLKHIVQDLQKENSAAAQRNKVLESENKLLLSETEQLREDLKALEENVEQSILREEQALVSGHDEESPSSSGAIAALQKKYESELEQVRKRLMDSEMKTARTIHDLNKEIGELETLIESKIYREDELEREVERLKDKLARSQKKSSKTSSDPPLSSSEDRVTSSKKHAAEAAAGTVCEICERPGHDIFTCDLLKEDASPLTMGPASATGVNVDEELFCEDCEGRGHTAANCPHSLDVF